MTNEEAAAKVREVLGGNARIKYESQRFVPYEASAGGERRFVGYSWEEVFNAILANNYLDKP